ncbi:MAG: HAMP domain-containing histidine kinase, partial [Thermoflexales bacterium]|nr:HAMP domain-containing histidine kinase [Thermoflexales bacterium]
YWEAATIAPIWDEHGTITHFLAVKEDITERKRAEAALRDLNATLEQRVADRTAELQAANLRLTELDHLKDEFLARISHELRTPLTGILISLELLEAAKPEKRERYLQRLKQSAGRLRDMIEDVLMFSQLNLYTRPETLSPIDLNDLIACHLTTWQKLSAGHDLQLQLDLTHDLPHVRTDGELIGQAINRLVINAINYTPAGSVIVSTATRDEDDRRGITISVADTGPGITPDDLPHIFERFYRGRAAADYQTPGTGIGLSISREIAEKLGGRLTVDTQVGVGSTFTLWLPVTA